MLRAILFITATFGLVGAASIHERGYAQVADEFARAQAAEQAGDFASAVQLYRAAAGKGHVAAQLRLSAIYDEGELVAKDSAEALRWLQTAAQSGHSGAQALLGMTYEDGIGVLRNTSEAARWYHLAAEQGVSLAQARLGRLLAVGEGVPQDFVEAHKWLNLAAAAPYDGSTEDGAMALILTIGPAKEAREMLAGIMTPAQIAEAQHRAAQWKPVRAVQ